MFVNDVNLLWRSELRLKPGTWSLPSCCFPRQETFSILFLSTLVTYCWGEPCDGLASHPGEQGKGGGGWVSIFSVASCYRNRAVSTWHWGLLRLVYNLIALYHRLWSMGYYGTIGCLYNKASYYGYQAQLIQTKWPQQWLLHNSIKIFSSKNWLLRKEIKNTGSGLKLWEEWRVFGLPIAPRWQTAF